MDEKRTTFERGARACFVGIGTRAHVIITQVQTDSAGLKLSLITSLDTQGKIYRSGPNHYELWRPSNHMQGKWRGPKDLVAALQARLLHLRRKASLVEEELITELAREAKARNEGK